MCSTHVLGKNVRNKLVCLSPASFSSLGLITCKGKAYPSKAPFMCSTHGLVRMFVIRFVPCKLFQPSIILVSKGNKACLSEAPFRCSTLGWAPGFTARDKHSNLPQPFVNYFCKKFHKIGPRWSHWYFVHYLPELELQLQIEAENQQSLLNLRRRCYG